MIRLRTAKSCGPGAATLALRRRKSFRRQRGQERPLPRGEHEGNRENLRAGKAGMIRLNLWWIRSCALLHRTRGCGCSWHPAFPAPSYARRERTSGTTRADRAAGMLSAVWKL